MRPGTPQGWEDGKELAKDTEEKLLVRQKENQESCVLETKLLFHAGRLQLSDATQRLNR